jgi:hypothetical protein
VKAALPVLLVCATAPAAADRLADAIIEHTDGDVAMLHGRPDADARCTLGAVYLLRDDLPRAALYLDGCDRVTLAPEIRGWIPLALRTLDRRLAERALGAVVIATEPTGIGVTIDELDGESLTTPVRVWLPPGSHEIRVFDREGRTQTTRVTAERGAERDVALDVRPKGEIFWAPDGRTPDPIAMHEHDCVLARRLRRDVPCTGPPPPLRFTQHGRVYDFEDDEIGEPPDPQVGLPALLRSTAVLQHDALLRAVRSAEDI